VIVGETAGWATQDFPWTPGTYDTDPDTGFTEVFAARLAADGSAVQWATAFGGRDWDSADDAALDTEGDVHITGTTESTDFPTTAGALDRLCNNDLDVYSCTNHPDAFALELSADGSQLRSSTFVGGTGYDHGYGIAVDGAGRTYVTGTASAHYDFPLVDPFESESKGTHAWCAARADCSDAFLVRLDAAKAHAEYGTLYGGLSGDEPRGVTLAGGDAWIAGYTHSPDLATAGPGARGWAGGNCGAMHAWLQYKSCSDAFLARIDEAKPPAPPPPPGGGGSEPVAPGGGTSGPGVGGAAGTGAGSTPAAELRLVARHVRVTRIGRRVRGRVRAPEAPACARHVPVVLQVRRNGAWRAAATTRSGGDRRFALRAPRRVRPLRLRLPALTREPLRCGALKQRVR
jgi:hypothetical protein